MKKIRKQNAITIVGLIISIIILLILAVVTISEVQGQGIIAQAIKAKFYAEMSRVEEAKEMSDFNIVLEQYSNEKTNIASLGKELTKEELKNLESTLKAEIIYTREGFGEKERLATKQIWKNNMYGCKDAYEEELISGIYYITKEVSGKEETYIWDKSSDTCFKIPQTNVGKYTVHSLPYAKLVIDGINSVGVGTVEYEAQAKSASDGTLSYEPDLNNFSYTTEIVYYSEDFSKEYTMPIKEFIESGKPNTQTIGGIKYIFADYTSSGTKRWANIKTTANGLEGYWVWIPRYAYKLDADNEKADIIFIDVSNKQMDGSDLPKGYTVHESFKQKDGLKGIWFSKYNPSSLESVATDQTEPGMPDLTNFNTSETKLIYYDENGENPQEEEYTKNSPQTIVKNGTTYYWYNYTNKIWANVKTEANGLECWWVWLPRFAYKLESGTTKVIFVDTNNKPLDTATYGDKLPTGYTLHEAFKQKDGLKGIWFSKYNPTATESGITDQTEPQIPDLTNFNTSETKLIYYDANGNNPQEEEYTENPLQTIVKNGTTYYWYNYKNKIWANVKTEANGLEAWWVWLPRFAYKLESGTTRVIFVDTNNKPLNTETYGETLPEGYTLHEAFNQKDGLKGIWFSKYNPTKTVASATTE